ncbi:MULTISPECIES: conjugal transfer protein TraP [Citrobacter freundii complex]|uniref:conjugal transfer protein TraP n=1 Tax=Citrobacter freundii complex TaxID=1344959 RepID=UPI0012D5587C|nr:conjugal transfer protein TraP [Citrobacter portucalensis]EBX6688676.1 hypothetical protein [Salmonella enterica subsp. salamae serovar Sofia]MDE9690932.1 hypothetical protein [Citrobacter portucalensis]HAW0450505.1 hypothetical protein [Escherichia coli]HDV8339563.1 hypothetical protein [Enterobacter hormaechei]
MINKTLALIAYGLRWLAWAVHYLVIWPAGSLVLIVALLFCLDNTTPGAVAVDYLQKAGNITDGQRWTWRECTKQPPVELPPPSVFPEGTGSLQQDECPEVVSDARGYAAYVDRTLQGTLTWLWVLMGLTYAGLAWLLGLRPYFPRYVFVKVADGKGYIRRAFTRPERGMGVAAIFPVKKGTEKHQGCDVYVSSLSSPTIDKSAEWPENESEK